MNQHFNSAISTFFFNKYYFIYTCGISSLASRSKYYQITKAINRAGTQLKTQLTFGCERRISIVFSALPSAVCGCSRSICRYTQLTFTAQLLLYVIIYSRFLIQFRNRILNSFTQSIIFMSSPSL